MHPDDDHIYAYEPYQGPERRITSRATAENQDEIKVILERHTNDLDWIKKSLTKSLYVAGAIATTVIGLVVTYTVSTHNDIAKLQEQLARFDTLAKSHHNSNGCHFRAVPGGLP